MLSMVLCLALALALAFGKANFCQEGLLIHKEVCVPGYYNKAEPPNDKVSVKVGFLITDFSSVDEDSLTVTVGMYLSLIWQETRLTLNLTNTHPDTRYALNILAVEHLWKPDVFISNLVEFKKMKVLDALSGLSVFPDKNLEYWVTVKITFACKMNFAIFPFDEQTCPFHMQSSNYVLDELEFTSYYDYNTSSARLQEYDIVIGSIDKKDQIFHEDGDLYSQVGFVVTIKRHFRAFLMEYFIPCFAMVLVSFVSFTIPADAIPGRVALLVTVFLVLSTFFGDIQSNTPKSDGLTALQVYALSCMLFSFGAMLEYAVVLLVIRIYKNQVHMAKKGHQRMTGSAWKATTKTATFIIEDSDTFAFKADKHSSILLLLLFVIFNVAYIVYFSV